MRKAGVLMAISSLPSKFGIGDFGSAAFSFVDYLAEANIAIWQILPFNRLGYGNSPYQAYSSIAGDEIFISIGSLVEEGYLAPCDITHFKENATRVAYDEVRLFKMQYLRKAFAHFKENYTEYESEFLQFIKENDWVYTYSVFLTLKSENNGMCWTEWTPQHRRWIADKKADLSMYAEEIKFYQFLQFIFFKQWYRLKAYANAKGVSIMGDIAYYVGLDSLDVWENQEYFLLGTDCKPIHVAGVPPDYFTADGQRWGNPIYNWEAIERYHFHFWIERLCLNAKVFDCLRIDHFRAFDTYWKIPASAETAVCGEWMEAPGYAFFDVLFEALPEINLVVEDLGNMRPEVFALRDHYHFMGMEIMQFSFSEAGTLKEEVLCELGKKILYTGTHDNQTTLGWFLSQSLEKQKKIKRYLNEKGYQGTIVAQMIQYALDSIAPIVIIPVCDILGLDDESRMNTPGTIGSPNWEWKLVGFTLFEDKMQKFAHWAKESKRVIP